MDLAIHELVGSGDEISIVQRIRQGEEPAEAFVEYVALMTDTFALDLYNHLFSPETRKYYF